MDEEYKQKRKEIVAKIQAVKLSVCDKLRAIQNIKSAIYEDLKIEMNFDPYSAGEESKKAFLVEIYRRQKIKFETEFPTK